MTVDAPHVWIPKALTKLDKLKASFASGRKKTVSPGSHLHDIVSLRQTVLMCPRCDHKFRQIAKKHGYRKTPFDADAACDDCRCETLNAKVYAFESNYDFHCAPHPDGGRGKYGEIDRPTKPKWQPFKITLK
jgi:hypothetical protein